MKFTDIAGQIYAKRALEVALVQGHSIWFIGSFDSQNSALADLGFYLGLSPSDIHAIYPCPCSFYGHPSVPCTCSIERITEFRIDTWPMCNPDIAIALQPVDVDDIIHWAQNDFSDGETHDSVMHRVERARERLEDNPDVGIEDAVWPLLRAAVPQLRLTPLYVASTLAVAKSISALSDSSSIKTAHIAEAIQYRLPNKFRR